LMWVRKEKKKTEGGERKKHSVQENNGRGGQTHERTKNKGPKGKTPEGGGPKVKSWQEVLRPRVGKTKKKMGEDRKGGWVAFEGDSKRKEKQGRGRIAARNSKELGGLLKAHKS